MNVSGSSPGVRSGVRTGDEGDSSERKSVGHASTRGHPGPGTRFRSVRESRVTGLVALVVLAASLLALLSWRYTIAAQALPIPAGDSVFFYPVAFNLSQGLGLAHPFLTPLPDATDYRFTWHGWSYPLLLSLLNWGRTYPGVVQADIVLASVNTILGIALIARFAGVRPIAIALVPVLFNFCMYFVGRPDALAFTGLLLLVGAQTLVRDRRMAALVTGLILGGLGVTQPTIAVMAVLLWLTGRFATGNFGEAVRASVATGAVAATTVLALSGLLYPYPLHDWLRGLADHARFQAERADAGSVAFYYLLDPKFPLLGVWATALLALVVWSLRARWRRAPVILLAAASAFGFWWFGIRLPQSAYNVVAFVAVAAVTAPLLLDGAPATVRRGISVILVAMSITATVAIARSEIVHAHSVRALQYPAMVAGVRRHLADPGATVGVPRSYLPFLLEEMPRVRVDDDCIYGVHSCTHLVLAQAHSGYSAAPLMMRGGFRLLESRFASLSSETAAAMARTPRAFNYAVYERVPR